MKFYCLQRTFISHGEFELFELESKDSGKAWEEIEDGISGSCSQEWLIDEEELNILRKLLEVKA